MLTNTLSQLIGFKTLSRDHAATSKALSWIKTELAGLPLTLTDFSDDGFPALLVTTRAIKSPKLWLQGHLDVVNGSDEAFVAQIKNGRLYGRGSFDMKFGIACYIELLKQLGPALPDYDLGVMITTDEEIGGFHGVKAILDAGYSSEAVFLPDGGRNWNYVSAARGIWHIRATALGISEHGSKTWLGSNAINTLTDFLYQLRKLFPTEPCGVENHFHNTANVGIISGGEAINQIPYQAHADIDIRYLLEQEQSLKQQVNQLVEKYQASIKLEVLAEGSGYRVDTDNRYYHAFRDAVKTVTNREPTFEVTYGSSDARYFMAKGIPPIVMRPTGAGDHSENEWIDLTGLDEFYRALTLFVTSTTKKVHRP